MVRISFKTSRRVVRNVAAVRFKRFRPASYFIWQCMKLHELRAITAKLLSMV